MREQELRVSQREVHRMHVVRLTIDGGKLSPPASNLLQVGALFVNSAKEITELSKLESFPIFLTKQEVCASVVAQFRAGFVIYIKLIHQFVPLDLEHSVSRNFYPVHSFPIEHF